MLAPLEMSVPAADGLILKGTLTYPTGRPGELLPLAVLAHHYPATRDSFAPLVRDLLAAGIATLAFDQRGHGASIVGPKGPVVIDAPDLSHVTARLVPGTAHAMASYFDVRDELVPFLRRASSVA